MQKTIIITGANSGLGFEATKQIAQRHDDYQLIMACRNMQKATAARKAILQEVPNANLLCLALDTSSLAKVRAFVDAFKALNTPLDGLICNAGIAGRVVHATDDGFNNIFETNYLGHFLLTQLLLPTLANDARLIFVSSDRHDAIKDMPWPGAKTVAHVGIDALVDSRSYPYSKLCMILFTYELERRLAQDPRHIVFNAANPGLMTETGLAKDKSRFTPEMLAQNADILSTAKDSGRMLADLMCNSAFAQGPARYFDRRSDNPIPSSKLSYDQQVAKELWDFSLHAVGLAD
ncbi:SDR family NAD(P)-dependent oxidoreductase [Lacticaseibacillus sp. N501-2]|uniref:SDR family NAD(P)-dependent oxidoreductase n=1 Tax=Lacticaseibacillus salsurae TaxID=3367729 RepID=UPI0038B3CBB4